MRANPSIEEPSIQTPRLKALPNPSTGMVELLMFPMKSVNCRSTKETESFFARAKISWIWCFNIKAFSRKILLVWLQNHQGNLLLDKIIFIDGQRLLVARGFTHFL